MKDKHWILESAILVALGTGILYSFGHFYDYRIRYEFDIHTISLGVPPEVLIHDGATVIIAWFGSTKEFWIALILLSIVVVLNVFVKREFQKIKKINVVLISMALTLIIFYASVINYIPSRANQIASAIENLASSKRQSLILGNGEATEGYTIMGTPLKVAFLTSDNIVIVVQHSEINRIVANKSSLANKRMQSDRPTAGR